MMRWPTIIGAAIVAAPAILTAGMPAHAQRAPCGDGAGIIAHLEKEYGEDPAVLALDAAGRMVRILVNPETGSWSMLITGPGGPTCLVSHGQAWQPIPSTGSGQAPSSPTDPGDPS